MGSLWHLVEGWIERVRQRLGRQRPPGGFVPEPPGGEAPEKERRLPALRPAGQPRAPLPDSPIQEPHALLPHAQKIAILFFSFSAEIAARLFARFSVAETEQIAWEMTRLPTIRPKDRERVLAEFCFLFFLHWKHVHSDYPTLAALETVVREEPEKIVIVVRKYWHLDPAGSRREVKREEDRAPLRERPPQEGGEESRALTPGERTAIFLSYFPLLMVKRVLGMLTEEELAPLGAGMLRAPQFGETTRQRVWNEFLPYLRGNWEEPEFIVTIVRAALKDELSREGGFGIVLPVQKLAVLLYNLPDEQVAGILSRLFAELHRDEVEQLILTVRQFAMKITEREKMSVIEEFLGTVKKGLVPLELTEFQDLVGEVERVALRFPSQVAKCLDLHWLSSRTALKEFHEMAVQSPGYTAQQLLAFYRARGTGDGGGNPIEKAACFLSVIHPEIRHEILRHLEEVQEALLRAMLNQRGLPLQTMRQAVLQEFLGQYYFYFTTQLTDHLPRTEFPWPT